MAALGRRLPPTVIGCLDPTQSGRRPTAHERPVTDLLRTPGNVNHGHRYFRPAGHLAPNAPTRQCDRLSGAKRTTSTRHVLSSACSIRQDGPPKVRARPAAPGFSTQGRSRWSQSRR